MIRLLKVNYFRLKKNFCFCFLMGLMCLFGVFLYINNIGLYPERCINCDNMFEEMFFNFLSLNWIIMPIFISLFIGTEYSDGVIKNKIVNGHKRTNIYFANLLASIIVCFIYSICYVVFALITGIVLKHNFILNTSVVLVVLFNSIFLNILISSLFTFVSMVISNNKGSVITSMAIVIWSMIVVPNIFSKMQMVSGSIKIIYNLLLKILPYGQIFMMSNFDGNYSDFWIYSIIMIVIFNFYGVFLINKKEIN